ncbi:MAG: beta-mannanase [Hamadaea sp.]|nr:beta-mannanase [Hamadaea sp.]
MTKRGVTAAAALIIMALVAAAGLLWWTSPGEKTGSAPFGGPGGGTSAASESPSPAPAPFPPPGKVFLGLQTNLGPHDLSSVDAFAAATGTRPSVLQFSQGWAADRFDASAFDRIVAAGMLPILSWEPWDYTKRDNENQPAYRLSAITAGRYDDYIRSWAEGIAALAHPVVIRFAHEMNGFWYPWCEQSNGNGRGDYVKAWRHVHGIFQRSGADNVTWLWSPNVTYAGAAPLKGLYPGDAYVDWIGLSGYYGTAGREAYISFDQIFRRTVSELAGFTRKPIVVTETGATNASGQQARWITQMFAQLPKLPQIIGVIWFETDKEIDWRIAGAPAAAAAFGKGAAGSRYDARWTPSSTPRTGGS